MTLTEKQILSHVRHRLVAAELTPPLQLDITDFERQELKTLAHQAFYGKSRSERHALIKFTVELLEKSGFKGRVNMLHNVDSTMLSPATKGDVYVGNLIYNESINGKDYTFDIVCYVLPKSAEGAIRFVNDKGMEYNLNHQSLALS